MTTMLTKHRAATFLALALVMVAVGIIVWWRFPESTGVLTAQERMEDICASTTYPLSFDFSDRATMTEDGETTTVGDYDIRANGRDKHVLMRTDGNPSHEAILIYPGGEGATRSSSARQTGYIREFTGGRWGDWKVNVGDDSATTTNGGAPARSDGDLGSFCGLPLEIPGHEVEFRYVGEETIDGTNTSHYFHSASRLGDDGYTSTEYWLDSNGLIKQTRWIVCHPSSSGSPESRFENLRTFSGWGETNVIAAPVQGTPVPTPAPTATPSPKSTSTPVPSKDTLPTPIPATATPIPTVAPTVTPAPTATPSPTTLQGPYAATMTVGLTTDTSAENVVGFWPGVIGSLSSIQFTTGDGRIIRITGLVWRDGRILLGLDPNTTTLYGLHIELGDLVLHGEEAEYDAGASALSWEVQTQPWHEGNQVTVGIRQSEE